MKRKNITVDEEKEDLVVCTLIDQVTGRDMTKRGKTIALRWSCWSGYDVADNNFVFCIRSAIGSGFCVTKMRCCQCKLGPRRKCRYEAACIVVLKEAGSVSLNDNVELQEVGDEAHFEAEQTNGDLEDYA